MPNISNLTLAQLRAATKAQILTAIGNYLSTLSKRQLIALLWDVAEDGRIDDDRITTWRSSGQLDAYLDVHRDVLGNKTGTTAGKDTYNPDGTADTIVVVEYDADNLPVRRRTIKYRYDGQQPDVTVEV